MSGIESNRKLPFRIDANLWPEQWAKLWESSSIVKGWPVRHRGNVKQSLSRFLAYTVHVGGPNDPNRPAIKGFVAVLEKHLSKATVITYMEQFAYGLLALFPEQDWQWLQETNRSLRVNNMTKYPKPPACAQQKPLLRLPFDEWPFEEQARWNAAFEEPKESLSKRYRRRRNQLSGDNDCSVQERDKGRKHPSKWSPSFRFRVERGWAMFGYWCTQENMRPLTPEAFSGFSENCLARGLSSVSVASYAFEAYRAGTIMYPELDWSLQRDCCAELKETSSPAKDKLQSYIPVDQLYAFAVELMENSAVGLNTKSTAIQFRDGLFLALLCLRPKRISNMGTIVIGEHLLLNGDGIPEHLYFQKTKNGEESSTPFPLELVPYFLTWMERFRPLLLKKETLASAMWIGRDGNTLGTNAFWTQLSKRTQEKFGKAIGPHIVRSCYATFFAELEPDKMLLVQRALDHRNNKSIECYQMMADSFSACQKLDQMLDLIRKPPPAQHKNY